jgi:uncharacterized protein YoxC
MANKKSNKQPKKYEVVLLEEINGKLNAIGEVVSDIPDMSERLKRVEGKVDNLETDVTIIKGVVTVTNRDLKQIKTTVTRHDREITRLKSK